MASIALRGAEAAVGRRRAKTIFPSIVAVARASVLLGLPGWRRSRWGDGWGLYYLLRLLPKLRQEGLTVAAIAADIVRYNLRRLNFKLLMCHGCLTPRGKRVIGIGVLATVDATG